MAEKKGVISVVVPVYNAERYLEQAVESVRQQNYQKWEMFLVVSDSEDNSCELAESFAERYENIYCIHNIGGIGKARNIGMEAATGEYLLFMDADDYLPEESVFQNYINIAEKIDVDIVVSNYVRLWNERILPVIKNSSFSIYNRDVEEFRFRGFFSVGTLSYVWGKLYRSAFLKMNEISFTDFSYAEDKLFNMQCYCCKARYAFVESIGYVYRRNEMSVSNRYNPEVGKCWLGIAEELKNWLTVRGKELESYEDLIQYTIFFASFFDAKMEYEKHKKSVWSIRKILKIYGQNVLARNCFCKLAVMKKTSGLEQIVWRILIWGFSWGMKRKCYLLLSIGVKCMIKYRVDERLSDTGLRE